MLGVILFTVFIVGSCTDLVTAERVDRNVALLTIGQWFVVAGGVGWAYMSLDNVVLVILWSTLTPQFTRIGRRGIYAIIQHQRKRKAAQQYLCS